MSHGNPQDGHSSNSSSASGMPGLVFSESGRSSGENWFNDANSSDDKGDDDEDNDDEGDDDEGDDDEGDDEGDNEDTLTEAAARHLHSDLPAVRREQLSLFRYACTKCQHFCSRMHPPCVVGGPWIRCQNQCTDKHDHNGRHSCYGDCHNQPSTFKVQVRVM
jgi:hypothetical protein